MTRIPCLVLLVPCLLLGSLPAAASQPSGLAGMLIAEEPVPDNGLCLPGVFEGYLSFGAQPLDPGDSLTVSLAVIPFQPGEMLFGLDEGAGGTFAAVIFSGGFVEGLRYNSSGWNDFTITLSPGTQSFTISVNGVRSGPIPYGSFCADQGGCTSVQALRIHQGAEINGGAIGWIDSLSIVKESATGTQVLAQSTFDNCFEIRPDVVHGALVREAPPRTRGKR